jgi:hypothetical protein
MADENFRSAEFAHVFRGHRLSSPHVQVDNISANDQMSGE